ncbi:MAG: hypothetical protein Q9195_004987, partial [Heterodermia aff. obscurata]
MSNVKGASAAPPVAGRVVGSGSRVSKPQGKAAGVGGGKKKQSGPYAGMTNKEIRQRKARERLEQAVGERLEQAVEERMAEAALAARAEDSAAGENRDGGNGHRLLGDQSEGPDVNPEGRGQASSDLESVHSPILGSQAQSRRRRRRSESDDSSD